MKNFVDLIPFFQSYAVWVRWLVALWLIYSAALGGVLLFASRTTPPEATVSIDDFRLAKLTGASGLVLDFLVRNAMSQESQLVELKLVFYGEEKPSGGLQAFSNVSAVYVLTKGPEADRLMAGEANSGIKHDTQISFPYQGQDYAEVSIPVSQTVAKDGTDRFIVQLKTDALPRRAHRHIEAVIRYNDKRLTNARVVALRH